MQSWEHTRLSTKTRTESSHSCEFELFRRPLHNIFTTEFRKSDSYNMLVSAPASSSIAISMPRNTSIMVMIRPRVDDFLYSPSELAVMLADISAFKKAGADGVVFGCLNSDGSVDLESTERQATGSWTFF